MKRKKRKKVEMEKLIEQSIQKFLELEEEVRNSIWLSFYQSKLAEKVKSIVFWLLLQNRLLNWFDELYPQILFKCFKMYIVRAFEGKYSMDFLESQVLYNAKHFTIFEITRLKKHISINEDILTDNLDEIEAKLQKVRSMIKNKISDSALKVFDKLYFGDGEITDEEFEKGKKELLEALGLKRLP